MGICSACTGLSLCIRPIFMEVFLLKNNTKKLLCILLAIAAVVCVIFACFMLTKHKQTDLSLIHIAKSTLDLLGSNLSAAKEENLPICQDTGMACVFVELGTDVHIDGSFEAAIHEGVRRGYTDGYLRKSIVTDPCLLYTSPVLL